MARLTITDVEPLTTRLSKTLLVILAAYQFVTAIATADLPYVRYSAVWATVFVVASIASVSAAAVWRRELVALAGALAIVAFAMRGGVLVLAWQSGLLSGTDRQQNAQLAQGVVNWGLHVVAWSVIFSRGTMPLVARTTSRR